MSATRPIQRACSPSPSDSRTPSGGERGIKTAELRSRPTAVVGERFYLYASKAKGRPPVWPAVRPPVPVWSEDLGVATPPPPPLWMVELAGQVKLIEPELLRGAVLPTGVIVGTAVIDRVVPPDRADGEGGVYRWELADVRRVKRPRKPTGHPQPVWFQPF